MPRFLWPRGETAAGREVPEMPQPPRRALRAHAAHERREFGDLVYARLREAPWLLASLGVHGVVFLVLLLLPQAEVAAEPVPGIVMAPAEEPLELEDEPPEIVPPEPIIEDPRIVESPEIVESKTEGQDDVHCDEGVQSAEEDAPPGLPFEGPGTNATIGIGGDGGGSDRAGFGDRRRMRGRGDSSRTVHSVDLALEWLRRHQSSDGRWDADGFDAQCKLNRCDGPGDAVHDVGLTGLALCCFLAAGETHRTGEYRETVAAGLKWLKAIQDTEGCFGSRNAPSFQYDHACAALAMAEAYGMTGSVTLKDAAQRGVAFVQHSQNPYLAWRYGVRDGENDTSVTGWMVMALKSAHLAALEVDGGAFRSAMAWIDKMTEPEFGRTGYRERGGPPARTTANGEKFPADRSESLTAVGVLTRIFCGRDPKDDPMIGKGTALMLKRLPQWDQDAGTIDFYYWYYGTLAAFQVGGEPWKRWREAMEKAIAGHQNLDPKRDEYGSWDPVDVWSVEGGRVYATALNCLSLQACYRYGRGIGMR